MSQQETRTEKKEPRTSAERVIHRVCITCNNMFRVTPENYEAKQCPNCHKTG